MAKNQLSMVGSISFLFGAAIAIILGIINLGYMTKTFTSLLILLGIAVGLLNITKKETSQFLIATVSLVIVSAFGGAVLGRVAEIGPYLEGILTSILTFVIPATIVVALKTVYGLEERR
ncbi:hypothetical protein HYU12_00280 [Candidatus Woesearchaeota archaeon]|nr:hypothetical protein [Candidatus Woesearchaeota archaeon]